jgi:hypothetical protein
MKKKSIMSGIHKWLGLPAAIVMLYMSCSGILLNHPRAIAPFDAPTFLLPADMRISTWGRGAAQCFAELADSTLVVGGKTGVLVIDADSQVERRRTGLPRSVARGEVLSMVREGGKLLAATASGVFESADHAKTWNPAGIRQPVISLVSYSSRVAAFTENAVHVLTGDGWQSHSLRTQPEHGSKTSLIHTVFSLHSGAILGLPGRILIDIAGAALFILSLGGIILFVMPSLRGSVKKSVARGSRAMVRYHLNHHKRLGLLLLIPMLLLPVTGFFMRPPFVMLLAPRNKTATPVVHPPQFGGTAAAAYDSVRGVFVLADKKRLYSLDTTFSHAPRVLSPSLPVHPMGITGLAIENPDSILVGSFSGLLRYRPSDSAVTSFASGMKVKNSRYPRHEKLWQVRALGDMQGRIVVVDFRKGPFYLDETPALPAMPENIGKLSPFSLWNFLFEVHNGRILRSWLPKGYVLHNPVAALLCIVALASGILVIVQRQRRSAVRGKQGAKEAV